MTTPFAPTRGPVNPGENQLAHTKRTMSNNADLRFAPGIGWLKWNETIWVVDDNAAIHAAQRSAEAIAQINPTNFSTQLNTWRGLVDVVNIAKTLPAVQVAAGDLDRNKDVIACRNGVVELRTGILRPGTPGDLITKAVDVDYDPAALAPLWEDFLSSCHPSSLDTVDYLQRLAGYGITGHTNEQMFAVFAGSGGNGKSVFCDTLGDVFKAYSETVPVETFMQTKAISGSAATPDVARMRGARLIFTSEADFGSRLAEARVKLLTGDDNVTARFLNAQPFTFKPSCLLILTTNALPEIRGRDDGIWRRVRIVEWKESFTGENRDKNIVAKLAAESQGILTWAVRGAVEWYRRGLDEPRCVVTARDQYKASQDAFAWFLGVYVEMDRKGTMTSRQLMDAYSEACFEENITGRDMWGKTAVFRALRERGVKERVGHARALVWTLRKLDVNEASSATGDNGECFHQVETRFPISETR